MSHLNHKMLEKLPLNLLDMKIMLLEYSRFEYCGGVVGIVAKELSVSRCPFYTSPTIVTDMSSSFFLLLHHTRLIVLLLVEFVVITSILVLMWRPMPANLLSQIH